MAQNNQNSNKLRSIYANLYNEDISDIELEKLKNQLIQLVKLSLNTKLL
jgi:hypothetical protein